MDGDSYRAKPDAWRTGQPGPGSHQDSHEDDVTAPGEREDLFNAQAILAALSRPDAAAPAPAPQAPAEKPDLDAALRATFAGLGDTSDAAEAASGEIGDDRPPEPETEPPEPEDPTAALFEIEDDVADEEEYAAPETDTSVSSHDDARDDAEALSADGDWDAAPAPEEEIPLFDDAAHFEDEPEPLEAHVPADTAHEDTEPAAEISQDVPEDDAAEDDAAEDDEASIFAAPSAMEAGFEDAPDFPSIDDPDSPGRKPRIALMGEFSAGKSTLSNLLIGSNPLPTRVTATQLPPVWISWGDGQPYREDLDGSTHAIDIEKIGDIDPAKSRVIRLFCRSDILELCDIIDMPGISDPNMPSDVWERVIGKADGVLWCTHATQAWRQSEAAVWLSLDKAIFSKSFLLVTRFDKLRTEIDRARVLKRIERETRGLFAARLPISLTQALAAGDDAEKWQQSGAADFTDRLVALLHDLAKSLGSDTGDRLGHPLEEPGAEPAPRPRSVRVHRGSIDAPVMPRRVTPRRVRPVAEGGRRDAAF